MCGKMKQITKVLSVFLSLVLLMEIIPLQIFAMETSEKTENSIAEQADLSAQTENPAAEEEPQILAEDTEKRDEYTKHFRMSDGTIQAATYAMPVHFKSEDNVWQDYDNRLTETDADAEENTGKLIKSKDYVNTAADFTVRLSKKTNGKKFVRLEKDGYTLSWYYEGAKKKTGKATQAVEDDDLTTLEKVTQEVVYEDVFKDIDLQYIISSDVIKENFILHKKNTEKEFVAEYKCNGLIAVSVDSKTIAFQDAQGQTIYTVRAPYMMDAKGETSEAITLEILSQSNHKVRIQTSLNVQWLEAEEREYPVTVDPSIQTSQYAYDMDSAFVGSAAPNKCYGNPSVTTDDRGSLYVGNIYGFGQTKSYIKFQTLPNLGVASKVVDARLLMGLRTCEIGLRMDLRQVTSAWDSNTICWNNQPACASDITDYKMLTPQTSTTDYIHLEITDMVRGWYSGQYANNGVVLSTEKTSVAKAWFFSSRYTTYTVNRPMLLISYRNMTGYEDYWSYTNLSAGRDGVASVNNFNGNLVFNQPITEDAGGNLMPVNLSLVYNANGINAPYTYMANNIQTNYHIYLRRDYDLESKGYRYYLNDADGTKHWFYFANSTTTTGKDEDALGYTLDLIALNSDTACPEARFRITDKTKNKMYFNNAGDLLKIVNPNNVSATVQYETVSSYTRIKSITDGAGRVYPFSYHPNYPYLCLSIADPAGRSVSFDYSSGKCRGIVFCDLYLSLYYNDAGLLSQIKGVGGVRTAITYDSSSQKRVASINWGTSDSNLLESYSFSYSQNETKITDKYNRSYTYQFNNWGQNTGVVSNADGSAQYFKLNPGNDPGNLQANKVVAESKVIQSVTNYLVDPGFTRSFSASYWSYIENSPGYIVAIDSTKANVTKNALKLHKPTSDAGCVRAVQTVQNLSAGTYTLSSYVHTNGETLTGDGAQLIADIRDKNTEASIVAFPSEGITKADDWERISITFTIEEECTLRFTMNLGNNTSGTAWFDDIQLEKSSSMSSYNLIENSAMTNGKACWSTDFPLKSTGGLAGYPYCVYKNVNVEKTAGISQTMYIASGKKDDVFSFGAWVKAASAPINDLKAGDSAIPKFNLSLRFYNANNACIYTKELPVNEDLKTWQFVSGEAIATADYSKVVLEVVYYDNVNSVATVGGFCYKEKFGQTFDYDNNGNIQSVVDLSKAQSTFAFKNNQMTKMLNPSGSEYFYSYAYNESDLSEAVSTDGQRYSFTYDSKGNVLSSKIEQDKPSVTVEAGTKYIIRNAESGNVIDNGDGKGIVYNWRYRPANTNQIWLIVATNEADVYNLKSLGNGGLYMGVKNNANTDNADIISSTTASGDAFKFKIHANGDGSFRISSKSSNYTKGLDGQPNASKNYADGSAMKQWTRLSNDESQHWYFCPDITIGSGAAAQENIYSAATYTASGNFAAAATDQSGNTTTYSYNETKGLLNSATDALNRTTNYTYDQNTNALLSVSSGGMTNSYAYANRRLTDIHASNSVKYKLEYDAFGRTTNTKVGNGTTYRTLSSLEYGTNGLLSKQTYGNGDFISYYYDNLDRLVEKSYNNQGLYKQQYCYGSNGSISNTIDFSSNSYTKYVYDLADRVVGTKEYSGTSLSGTELISSVDYTYADKTNYLTGVKHFSPLGTQTIGYRYGNMGIGEMPDQIYGVTWNGAERVGYAYDGLGRLTNKQIKPSESVTLQNTYTYVDVANTSKTTTLVNTVQNAAGTFSYTYDSVGNITSVSDGTYTTTYIYDNLNQLVRENNQKANITYIYTYQNGNITNKTQYAYTTGTPGNATGGSDWQYSNSEWGDLLTQFNDLLLSYDAIGNLTEIDDVTLTWVGRQLVSAGDFADYAYNSDGQRISKTVAGVTTNFYYNGSILAGQKTGDDTLVFMYDDNGDSFGFTYNGTAYYYIKSIQNDVIAIADSTGEIVVQYAYDAWGIITDVTDGNGNEITPNANHIGNINPLRYRSYYYDTETGFYLAGTRYYDPEIGRFINADSVISGTGESVQGYNLFAYCFNNPVNMSDPTGNWPFFAITAAIGAVVGAVVGGVVAAKSGGNVWAGIGIGAAAGALIGTGAGMAAGAALAGSITATTGAVMAGGSALVSTVATGGFGAGATYIANNLSQAASKAAPVVQAGASKMQQVAAKGKAGEAIANVPGVKTQIPSLTGTANFRIPDGLDMGKKILSEVKNYSGTLSYTNQLKDFILYSQANGLQMHLYTNAHLTGPLQQAVDSGLIQLFPLG